MKRLCVGAFVLFIAAAGWLAVGAEIRLPEQAPLSGDVLIAEAFYKTVDDERVPLEFAKWPQEWMEQDADDFDVHVEAHPGDVIVLAPGSYVADVWVFTAGITIKTEPSTEDLAELWGTVEIVADQVTIERIAVVGDRKNASSGHGIEVRAEAVDVVRVRGCRIEDNAWTGVHVIPGIRNHVEELHVEQCVIRGNGIDGVDSYDLLRLNVSECTITDNGWNLTTGVGVRIFDIVQEVVLENNVISGNRFADVYYDHID